MTEDVLAAPVTQQAPARDSDKEINFAKLRQAREEERDARIRAEMREEQLRNEMQEIRRMLQPAEKDPLDGAEDYVDAAALKAKFTKERAHVLKETEAIARKAYRDEKEQDEKKNYLGRLQSQYRDYDEVMSDDNLAKLEASDPLFVETVLEIPDPYTRRLKTYKYLSKKPKAEEKTTSIQEKIAENSRNPYMIAPSVATPSGVDFDVSSPKARDAAYAKLKAAQKRQIGS